MPRPPYLNFPFQFYKTPSRNPYYTQKFSPPSQFSNSVSQYKHENHQNIGEEKNKSNKNTNDFLFDLFGLKIYYDDVLLISLIYFLYSEGVKDDGLFIVLILLLLS